MSVDYWFLTDHLDSGQTSLVYFTSFESCSETFRLSDRYFSFTFLVLTHHGRVTKLQFKVLITSVDWEFLVKYFVAEAAEREFVGGKVELPETRR